MSPHEIATGGSTNITINFDSIAVPDTGLFGGNTSVLQAGLWAAGAVTIIICAIFGVSFLRKKYLMRFPIRASRSSFSLRRNYDKVAKVLPFVGIFALSAMIPNLILPHIDLDKKASATVNGKFEELSLATLGDIESESKILEDGSAISTLTDTVLVETSTKHGYSLFVSLDNESGNLYLNGDSESDHYLEPTKGTGEKPAELADNSWGYEVDNDKWAQVPANGEAQLVKSIDSATLENDATDIKYGGKANSEFTPGAYKGTVVYTAVANYIPYAVTMKAAENTTITVERIASPVGEGFLGELKSGEEIFEDDQLRISGSSNTGYDQTILTVNGVEFTSGETFIVTDSVEVVTAPVEKQTFAVTYDCNGGDGSVVQQTKIYDVDLTLSNGSTCSNTGYRIDRWNTEPGGKGIDYSISGTYQKNEALHLYAIWVAQEYDLSITAGTGANITVNRTDSIHGGTTGKLDADSVIYYGDTLEITFGAELGYELNEYFINDQPVVLDEESKVTYTTDGNTAINATAKPIERKLGFSQEFSTITAERIESPISGSTGAIDENSKIYYGDKIKFSFTANPGYTLTGQKINDSKIELDAKDQYTYTVAANEDVTVYSKAYIEYQISYEDTSEEAENMPETQTSDKITDATFEVEIQEDVIPYRKGYSFRGWTSTKPSADSEDTAAISEYNPGNTISFTLDTTTGIVAVDQTGEKLTGGATLKLYAAWKKVTNFSSSITTMQGMNASVCDAATTPTKWDISASTGDGRPDTETIYGVPTTTLTDTRDGKTYTVAKLADGKCWMTQNLALERTDTFTTLTPSDSNVTSNFELPISQTSGSESWGNEEDQSTLDTKHLYSSGNSLYGNYYNYYTATAGTGGTSKTTGVASSSICPKGWRLPTSTRTGDFRKMMETGYGIKINSASREEDVNKLLGAPFFYVAAGQYTSGILMVGETARYWSATSMSAVDAYYATIDMQSHVINPSNYWHKFYGEPVRCIAE